MAEIAPPLLAFATPLRRCSYQPLQENPTFAINVTVYEWVVEMPPMNVAQDGFTRYLP